MLAAKLNTSASPHSQRGVAAIAVAVMFVTLFGFLAVVTDTGRLFLEKRSLQTNADLAALETALSFCRDQTMDEAERLAVATEVLSSTRNNFRGTASDITVELGRVNTVGDPAFKQFVADDSGKAVRVALTRTVAASLFQQLLPSSGDDVVLEAEGVSVACEPGAYLEIRSSVANIDTAESDLLNPILGDLLGTSLALSAGQWDSLLDTNLNLLSYLDALAVDLGITAGDYDTVLATDISIGQALDVAADVLTTAGADPTAIAALQLLDTSITPASPPAIQLGELLSIQSDGPSEALDVGLQVLQLVQGTIQLANSKNALTADVPISVLGLADVLIRIKVIEPPQLSAIGNPEKAKAAPFGSDQIYVRSGQIRSYISLDLPIVGAVLSGLEALLSNPLIAGLTSAVNGLFSLNLVDILSSIICIACQEDIVDIDILASPRVDIALTIGGADARITDYECGDGDKSLTVPASTSVASVALGNFGSDVATASSNVFSSDPLVVNPIPIVDIGTVRVRKFCILFLCTNYEYQTSSGWSSNPANAERQAFVGGGIGARVDADILGNTTTFGYVNTPDESYLPGLDAELTTDAFQELGATSIVDSLSDTLLGVDLEFYDPVDSSLLGTVTSLVGAVADTLINTITTVISSVLSPLLDPLLNQVLSLLGVSLADTQVGAAMTCETNKVRLIM